MEQSRYFNRIEIIDDYTIRKSSKDINKIYAEFLWYMNNHLFPAPPVTNYQVQDGIASYDIARIQGDTLSSIFNSSLDTKLSIDDFGNTLALLEKILRESVSVSKQLSSYDMMVFDSMYCDKTVSRLKEAKIDLNSSYIINDIKTPTIKEILDDIPVKVEPHNIKTQTHGDLCFSNIIIQPVSSIAELFEKTKSKAISCIDPRGYLPDGRFTNMGDINYDVAKLAHSAIGRYDQIKNDRGFDMEKLDSRTYTWCIRTTPYQSAIEKKFKQIFEQYDYYNIMIHLFFSMIPLHKDRPDHQEKMLVNALRLYLNREEYKI